MIGWRAAMAMAAAMAVLAGCNGGFDPDDSTPYLWPTPAYGVPWTAREFTVRYNEGSNTLEQVRALIAERCGPTFKAARVWPQRWTSTALHPHSLKVMCGNPTPRRPEFRGQTVEAGTLLSLDRGGPGGAFFDQDP